MSDVWIITWVDDVVICQVTAERLFADFDIDRLRDELTNMVATTPDLKLGIDLTLVGAVSSRFLGVLVELRKAIVRGGGAIALYGLHPKVLKVIEVTHMNKLLPIRSTREETVKSLRQMKLK